MPKNDPAIPGARDARAEFTTLTLDRRRFLVMLGGAAVATTLPAPLVWAGRAVERVNLQPWTLPESLPAGAHESIAALVGAAILAPSHWNSQPWRFEMDGGALRLALDPARTLPGCDPDQRFAHMSLGAALENLLVAARAWGQQPTVQYLPWGLSSRPGAPLVAASLTLQPTDTRRDSALFAALTTRRSNARTYEGRGLTAAQRAALHSQVPDELRLHWLDDKRDIRRAARTVGDAAVAVARDSRARADHDVWLRDGDGDARRRGDGVTAERLGLDGPLGWFAQRSLHKGGRLRRWSLGLLGHETEELVQASGALALLTSPRRADATGILAGQAYERLALKATSLGLAQQPLSAATQSEPGRAAIARAFGVTGEEPLLLVRIGHAKPVPATPRRAVALVTSWHRA
ncbi:MAG: hypothetical protein IT348_00385 [Candidatus Eisenbacteria bacterium]|nr:hypothetical protein [Candidatus Eisenbacteria bacterium]